ncbi:uncharacterized protein PODANS_4_5490 [Podospora anserina S mat+]|uniref:Podospora anserina S mat+ genomic DNA chromosome 4, supercontig 4 n=1 Tax=Podospora anserina (strain S / ATCC MYA-4624 / DSM 980 / FGSC 10383) TaxID=515849 RepID=B2AQ33_PODAN|nr:uncharacterized protein PODANS_4_5490 [Podospora anserina S mat+]CAP66972.1 unnamed protein product [Podospora anserina S mat+]CDP28714.1 Putative protein of unknown function [Podospora anserina S mat+]
MTLKGDAVWALGVMWFLCTLVFLLMCLRLYTRIVCLSSYGLDDHIYIVAFIFLLIFTIFIHLSGTVGFGQTMEEIGDMELVVKATLYECIGQGFAIVGMAIAKASLGTFLLRLVTVRWHRIAIWSALGLVSGASIAQVLCFWLSCVPVNYVYDRRIEGGYCPIDTRPTSYLLCTSTIVVDFFFALFPWLIVMPLQMPKREKFTIAGSMSLGLIAAAAGIVRTFEVEGLYTASYLKDSVGLIVWSSAEMAITLICIGIPVCRPLYKRAFRRLLGESTSGYHKQSGGKDGQGSSHALQTIGGGVLGSDGKPISKKLAQSQQVSANKDGRTTVTGQNESTDDISFTDVKLGVDGPFTRTTVGRGRDGSAGNGNSSDEEILNEYRRSQMDDHNGRVVRVDVENGRVQHGEHSQAHNHNGIMITETYRVERS